MDLFILIKKEVMQFFRNKTVVLTMFLFPVVLIVVMGISLNGLMNVDKSVFENKKVYYKINELEINEKYLNDGCTIDNYYNNLKMINKNIQNTKLFLSTDFPSFISKDI